jgi:hypothetical protein
MSPMRSSRALVLLAVSVFVLPPEAFAASLSITGSLRDRRYPIGQWPDWNVFDAVKEARVLPQRIDRGEPLLQTNGPHNEVPGAVARSRAPARGIQRAIGA